MIETCENYLEQPQTFTAEKMAQIHKKMQEEIGDDPDALELYEDLIKACAKYANMRTMWSVMSREEKIEQDALRTSYHNAVIMNLNMMARYLRKQGHLAEWREEIAPEEETGGYYRKAIGDFGCYVAFVAGLCSR